MRPRARPLASRAAFGFGTGIALGIALGCARLAVRPARYPYSALIPANAIGAWLGLGFILGASAKTVPTGALRGLVGLLSAVGAYYLLISLSEAGFRLIGAPHAATTWGAVALIAGPIFGAAGGAWRHWQGTGRALAVAVLAASLIAEGVVFGRAPARATSAASSAGRSRASGWSCRRPPAARRTADRVRATGLAGACVRVCDRADRRPRAVHRRPVLATVRRGTEGLAPAHQRARVRILRPSCLNPPPRSALMNFRRRALSLAAIAALSLALVPTPVLAAAIGAHAPRARRARPDDTRRA